MSVKTVIQYVPVGVTYWHAAGISLASILAGFGLGWYVKGRGWFGVKTDIKNAEVKIASV